jgi:hypothetical protein
LTTGPGIIGLNQIKTQLPDDPAKQNLVVPDSLRCRVFPDLLEPISYKTPLQGHNLFVFGNFIQTPTTHKQPGQVVAFGKLVIIKGLLPKLPAGLLEARRRILRLHKITSKEKDFISTG